LLRFQRLTENDWEAFEPLDKGCFPDDYVPKKLYQKYIQSKGFIGFFRDDELIGYMFLQVANKYGLLNRIAVKKEEQGKGYGSIMMTYVIDYFHKRRVSKIALHVETENKAAIALYQKFGFYFDQETWFCMMDENDVQQIEENGKNFSNGQLKRLSLGDLDTIVEDFPSTNVEEITKILEDRRNLVLGLFVDKELKAVSIFDPHYSGCRSLKCKELRFFDPFLAKLKEYRIKNYYNISFETNRQLAELCEKRGYKNRRHLWKMEKALEEWKIEKRQQDW